MLKNIERGIYSQWMTFSLLASAAFTPHSSLHNNFQEKDNQIRKESTIPVVWVNLFRMKYYSYYNYSLKNLPCLTPPNLLTQFYYI